MVGNCFSLQKEHDTALKFFQRAIQLQPDFAYAYTLSGHEYSANDDFEKAMACYRSAIRLDERHYNAWYPPPPYCLEPWKCGARLPPSGSHAPAHLCWGKASVTLPQPTSLAR